MQVRIGGYAFPAGLVAVATSIDVVDDARGLPSVESHTLTLQGEFVVSSESAGTAARQAELQAKCAALERAVRRPVIPDVIVTRDDGAFAFGLRGGSSLSGIKRRSGPNYPNSQGAEFVNFRAFQLVFTAEYPIRTSGQFVNPLVSFRETVSFSGGGPVRDFLQPVNGPPIRQVLYQATPYRAIQTGTASALGGWPTPPAMLWPADRLKDPEPSFDGPQRGPRGLEFAVSWRYEFGSERPLTGRPHTWAGGE